MEVIITKAFTKQFLRCPSHVQEAAKVFIVALQNAKSLRDIKDIEKLSGFKTYYRVRIGQYRIGLKEERPHVILMCVMERSQVYKVFPPKN